MLTGQRDSFPANEKINDAAWIRSDDVVVAKLTE
jgi:hypothetical protein